MTLNFKKWREARREKEAKEWMKRFEREEQTARERWTQAWDAINLAMRMNECKESHEGDLRYNPHKEKHEMLKWIGISEDRYAEEMEKKEEKDQ